MRRWIAVALASAAVCTVLDHLHVLSGVVSYPSPSAWQQAWWVPLLFALSSLAMLGGVALVRALFSVYHVPPPSLRELVGDGLGFVVAWITTGLGHGAPSALLLVLVGWWLARVIHSRPPWVIVFSLATAAGGVLVEAALSALGVFRHTYPDWMGVPRWLPGIYLHAALFAAPLYSLVVGEPAAAPSLPSRTTLPSRGKRG